MLLLGAVAPNYKLVQRRYSGNLDLNVNIDACYCIAPTACNCYSKLAQRRYSDNLSVEIDACFCILLLKLLENAIQNWFNLVLNLWLANRLIFVSSLYSSLIFG